MRFNGFIVLVCVGLRAAAGRVISFAEAVILHDAFYNGKRVGVPESITKFGNINPHRFRKVARDMFIYNMKAAFKFSFGNIFVKLTVIFSHVHHRKM